MNEQERTDKELARHEADTVMQRRLAVASMAISENQKFRDRVAQLEAVAEAAKDYLGNDGAAEWTRLCEAVDALTL